MCPHSTCIHKIPGKGCVHSHCAIDRNINECPICIKWKKKVSKNSKRYRKGFFKRY